MASDEEIFKKYALLRLTKDVDIVFSDFPSKASASLNYLSEVSGVGLIKEEEGHWLKEDDPIQPEMHWVENITPSQLQKKREDNIQNITKVFSPLLAHRITQFETYTKYFYDSEKKRTPEATDFFEKALDLLPQNSADKETIVIKNILQQQINKNKDMSKPFVDPFHQAIKQAYLEKDLLKKAEILRPLYYTVDNRDLKDIQAFTSSKKPVSLNRFRTELKRDFAVQIKYCFQQYGDRGSDVMFWQQEIDAHNRVLRGYKTRLLGEKGAFGKGGLYAPDSKLIGLTTNQKPNTYTQLKIFDDSHFRD